MSLEDLAQDPPRRAPRLPRLSVDAPYVAASACLAFGALLLFGLNRLADGAGPGAVPFFLGAMALLGLVPILTLVAANGAIRSLPTGTARAWRRAVLATTAFFYLWWFFVASSAYSAPWAAVFLPAVLLGAVALVVTPGSRLSGAVLLFVSSLATWLASLVVFGLPGR